MTVAASVWNMIVYAVFRLISAVNNDDNDDDYDVNDDNDDDDDDDDDDDGHGEANVYKQFKCLCYTMLF